MTIIHRLLVTAGLGVILSSCATGSTPTVPTVAPVPHHALRRARAIDIRTSDPVLREYLERVHSKIKANWMVPCVTNPTTQGCAYQNAKLTVEFGILKNGVVAYVEVQQPAGPGLELYDQQAVNAIKLSSPFPAFSPEVIAALKPGTAGMPVRVNFHYVVGGASNFGHQTSPPAPP